MSVASASDISGADRRRGEARLALVIYLSFVMVHLAGSLAVAVNQPFPGVIDELAHFSYVDHVRRQPFALPAVSDLRMLSEPDYVTPSSLGNPLSHPPLYYLLVAPFAGGADQPTALRVLKLRLVNVAISTAGLLLLFWIGWRKFTAPVEHAVFAAVVACCPKLGILGGSITNDSLAFLAGATTFLVLSRHDPATPRGALRAGAAFVLGAWTKLTAGVLLGLMVGLIGVRRFGWRVSSWLSPAIGILVAAAAIGAIPYLVAAMATGHPVYINMDTVDVTRFEQAGVARTAWLMARELLLKWAAFEPSDLVEISGFVLVIGLALRHIVSASAVDPLAGAGVLAALVMIPIHFAFIVEFADATGYREGMYFRYYLPVWPAFAIAAALAVGRLANRRVRLALALLTIALMVYGSVPVAILRIALAGS